MRHRAAAGLTRSGLATNYLMALMGWRSPSMAARYGAFSVENDALEAVRARFDRAPR
jgi:hypothetical protein